MRPEGSVARAAEPARPARTPRRADPARLGPLATLPLFLKLENRRAVLAGGNAAAAWKAELLTSAGARLDVYAPEPGPEMLALAAERPERVRLHARPWSVDVFAGAALAVGALEDEGEGRAFRCAARAAGVLVNVVDKPALCDAAFGAVVNRSPLVIGISTDGAAPVFGQRVRARIEALLPPGFAAWAQAARTWRARIEPLALGFAARRAFWSRFADLAERAPEAAPSEAAFEACCEGAEGPHGGSIAVVGAGPGDPELLTLKAVRLLQGADIVLHDDLVGPGVLDCARREAVKIAVGKRGGGASCAQGDICALAVSLAREGKRVVRLKGGDPGVFGRLDEELEAARAAGFEPLIVPGVTAASAAAAALGVSLTRRRLAPRLQFVAGHAADGGLPPALDLDALADPAATTCLYMGRRTFAALSRALVARGLAADTPVAVVHAASRGDEALARTTLAEGAGALPEGADDRPCLILIGRALAPTAPAPPLWTAEALRRPERAAAL